MTKQSTLHVVDKKMSERVQALRLDKGQVIGGPGRTGRRRWLIGLILLAGVLVGFYAYYSGKVGGDAASAYEVDAVTVASAAPVKIILDTTGYVIACRLVKVSPRIPGTIVQLNVEEGRHVAEGDVLARLDDGQYLADLNQAKAGLALVQARLDELRKGSREEDIHQARAALEQAKRRHELTVKDFARAELLKDTISEAEYDRIQSNRLEAEANVEQLTHALRLVERGPRKEQITASAAEVEQAKAALAKARFFYDGTKIVAPVSGTVLKRSVELGEMVRPESLTTSLFTIADLSELEAEIDIQERDVAEVRIGQPCLISTEAYPDRQYRGRLEWLSPIFNRQRGICRAKIKFLDTDERLAPDMNCRVKVLKQSSEAKPGDTIRIPRQAIVREAGRTFVYVLDGEVARRRVVRIGDSSGDAVEIREGLHSGEVVLLPGKRALSDGQTVQPRHKHNMEET